jgi:WD40 repeat protein/TPR repeat protein
MNFALLLADPSNPTGSARAVPLQVQMLETSPGGQDVTVTFQPSRTDDLQTSAKSVAPLVYRILLREGQVRSQIVVRLRSSNAPQNVVGHSAELLLALAIVVRVYEESGQLSVAAGTPSSIAATGALAADGSVLAVENVGPKLEAACEHFAGTPAIVFVPAANRMEQDLRLLSRRHPNLRFQEIGHLDEALEHLGIVLERVYLQNPFRGLECFEYQHRAVFFGREAETREAVAQLLRRDANSVPGLLIEGASGSGKSSFLRAGLLPALVNPRSQPADSIESLRRRPVRDSVRGSLWRIGSVSGTSGEAQLAQSILDCWRALPEFAGKLSSSCVSLATLAAECRTHWPSAYRFVWSIDQLEELFGLGLDAELIDTFGRFLLLLQSAGIWTIGCIRSDALPHLKRHDALRRVFGPNEGQYYLPTMIGTALEDVITRPAEVAGLTFGVAVGGKRLDQVLREDLYAMRDNTLPHLQFTLNELYMSRTGNELSYSAYVRLGGLTGSIATIASAVLGSEQKESGHAIRSLFRSLVSVDEVGNTLRRYAPMAEIGDPVQKRVLARLVTARLCVAALRNDQAVVSLAHDALLRTWPELVNWLQEETGLLQMREMAQRDTRLWEQHAESTAWLAPAERVAAFEVLQTSGILLTAPVRNFIEHSQRRVRRTSRVKQTMFAGISLLAIIASGASWVASRKQQEAEYQVAETRKAQARLLVEAAARRLKDGDVAGAQGIIAEVLGNPEFAQGRTPTAISVFQEIRAADEQLAVLAGNTPFRSATYSPDGARIVAASFDNAAGIWDAHSGKPLAVLAGHGSFVTSAVYSPDGARIVTTSDDKTARIWDAHSGKQLAVLAGHDGLVASAAYSPDGTRIVTASTDKTARIWDAYSGKQLALLSGDGGVGASAAYSPDGTRIVTASTDKTARIWDAHSGKQLTVLSGHDGFIASVAYSPDGARIVTASGDKTARVWDAHSGKPLAVLSDHDGVVESAAFSPDGTRIVTASADKTARIWDASSGKQLAVLSGHANFVYCAAYSPDGTRIVTASADKTARIWDALNSARLRVLSGHDRTIMAAAYSPDGTRIVTASIDKTARIWDAQSGAKLTALSGHDSAVIGAAYSPDGTRIVTASADKTARIWDPRSGQPFVVLAGHAGFVITAAYSPDGAQIVTASNDKTARIWDARTGAELAVLLGHHGEVNSAAFSPDGAHIVTASNDKTARIWDARSGKPFAVLAGHDGEVNTANYSPDGTRIVTASIDTTARVWDARSGKPLAVLSGHDGEVNSAAFSPDGTHIVTASADKTARAWDARTGTQLAVFSGHDGLVQSAAYSPDGTRIVTASFDKTARIWDARVPAAIEGQIVWDLAAQIDGLTDADRTQLGLPADGRTFDSAQGTPCDEAAAAFYDPDRRAKGHLTSEINVDIAKTACASEITNPGHSAQSDYQMGRALLAKNDVKGAIREFEIAISKGYRAAAIDLAITLRDQSTGALDPARAVGLLERAWKDHVPIAAYELGRYYENGLPTARTAVNPIRQTDLSKAWFWYQRGADAGEPNALARYAARDEDTALAENGRANRNSLLLLAFSRYAAAAQRAHDEGWPDDAWRSWRYRRATIARLLAREGMMQQIADAYGTVLIQFAPRPPTIWERLTAALR